MSYWQKNNDLLNRSVESDFIIRFIQQRVADKKRRGLSASFVLNIDAAWGEGKTFFMRGLFSDLKEAGHPAIMIDAWRDDFTGDPLTAVVAEFDQYLADFKSGDRSANARVRGVAKQVRRNAGKLSLLIGKTVVKRAASYAIGAGTDEVISELKELVTPDLTPDDAIKDVSGDVLKMTDAAIDKFAADRLDRFKEAKTSLANFQNSLRAAVDVVTSREDTVPPFFILVDELDRCRPTYAIEMLERIKHLFEVDNVVFVLSTDTTQLSNSVKAVYGNDFDSRHYLMRFFDRSYMLASTDRKKIIQWLIQSSNLDTQRVGTGTGLQVEEIIRVVSNHFDLEVRQIEKAIDMLATIALVWDSMAVLEASIVFPMIAAFMKGNDLSDYRKVKAVFQVESSPNNYVPLHIGSVNIGAMFDFIYNKRDTKFGEVERQCHDLGNRPHGDPALMGAQILLNELSAIRSLSARPLIRTYAERIRMAGRFNQTAEEY
jgi:hypothetical protein